MSFLRLLTLQIVEGRLEIEAARAIVIARAGRVRESAGGKLLGRHNRKDGMRKGVKTGQSHFERWAAA